MTWIEIILIAVLVVINNWVYYRFGQRKGFKVGADFVIKTMEDLTKTPIEK